jgi:hypothetical protein
LKWNIEFRPRGLQLVAIGRCLDRHGNDYALLVAISRLVNPAIAREIILDSLRPS